ncbi:hypothetical protein WICMUC_002145 [Wickerhamomyces mucosus]|uniref:Choline kinase N-terminal domain-containing protein n=1 Tax=Wickerhamomyces mucosus TaxID=1378264 RepID=A0A9P8PQ60_9ASCO|nr:hypothetical protein WICMUC_002145 [Wickerhamomyces mucosus]
MRSENGRSNSNHSRSRSRSKSKSKRPSLSSSRRNSAKSFLSLKSLDPNDGPSQFPYSFPTSPFLVASNAQAHGSIPPLDGLSLNSTVEIPTINANLDHTLPTEYFKQDLLSIIKNLGISKWHKLPSHISNDLQIKRMSGALTNAIYKVDPPPLQLLKNLDLHTYNYPSLLLRIYGPNIETIIDRDYELKTLVRLSKRHIGPRLFGCFTNGRIEQYLDNAITLTKQDIMNKKTSARIARRMKELHDGIRLSFKERQNGPSVWKNIKNWEILAGNLIKSNQLDELEIFRMSFSKFREIIQKYQEWLYARYPGTSLLESLVFCHNDTQYGNLLFTTPKSQILKSFENDVLPSSSSSVTTNFSNLSLENLKDIKPSQQEKSQDQNLVVIDFEYSGPNPPEYDIANHFCEWMQNYNHPTEPYKISEDDFPSLDEQLNLIYSYLIFQNPEFDRDLSVLEQKAKKLYNDCIAWRSSVSLLWALWAILQNGDKKEELKQGPNGETYHIIDNIGGDETAITSDEEEVIDGSDVDNFNYIKYAIDKIKVFLGDLIQLGIIEETQLTTSEGLKYLPTKMYKI